MLIAAVAGEAYFLAQKASTTCTVTRTEVKTVVVTKSAPTVTTTTTASTSSPKPAAVYVVVTDARGKEVKVPAPVRKVVPLHGLTPPFPYLLGAGGGFYGGWSWKEPFYKLTDLTSIKKTAFGRSTGVEEIAQVCPEERLPLQLTYTEECQHLKRRR